MENPGRGSNQRRVNIWNNIFRDAGDIGDLSASLS